MLIRSKKPRELSENQVTPERLFLNRRQVIGALGPGTAAAALSPIVRVTEAQVPPTLKIGRRGDHADGELTPSRPRLGPSRSPAMPYIAQQKLEVR
jgi:hypothetical protein